MYVSKKAQVLRSLLIVFLLTISANWNTSIASAQKSPSYSRDTILNELSEVHSTQEESQENISGGQAKDSSDSTQAENPSEYNILSNIAYDTNRIFNKDNWDSYGILALAISIFSILIAIFSCIFTKQTLTAQQKTEEHTQNAPLQAQIGILKDLPRHLYRNLACTCAALLKFRASTNKKKGIRLKYPSESNMLKLLVLPDDFILPIDASDEKTYCKMHEEKLLFRNYNLEIQTAAEHFANKSIPDSSLQNDYDNLLFKPVFLVTKMFELQDRILVDKSGNPSQENNIAYTIYAFIKEHLEKIDFVRLVKNSDKELETLSKIMDNDSFLKAISIKKDSIERSVKIALNYCTSAESIAFLHFREGATNTNINQRVYISRDEFIKFFFKKYAEESPKRNEAKTKKAFSEISKLGKTASEQNTDASKDFKPIGKGDTLLSIIKNVASEEDFARFIKSRNNDITDEQISKCYSIMKPYFDAFQSDDWKVLDTIYNILKIDTCLELNKIGMIDYS